MVRVHRLFVYGTLQHPPLLEQLLGRAPLAVPATAPGWRAATLRGRVYPGLVPDVGARARGALIDVDDDELAVLDRFEGPQYQRIVISTSTGEQAVDAHAWRLRAEHVHLALASDWDLDRFVAVDAPAFLGGSRAGDAHPRTS